MKKLRVIFLAFLAGCMFYISGGGSLLPEEAPVEITADGSDLAAVRCVKRPSYAQRTA